MISESELTEAGWTKEVLLPSVVMWNKKVGRTPLTYDPADGMIFQANLEKYKKHGFAFNIRDLYSHEESVREV